MFLAHAPRFAPALLGVLALSAWPILAEESPGEVPALKQLVEKLMARDAEREKELSALRQKVTALENAARPPGAIGGSPLDQALAKADPAAVQRDRSVLRPAHVSTDEGHHHLDISAGLLTSAGTSTAKDDDLQALQGGAHDPKKRGFTLQQLELSFSGAVDQYFRAETHLIFTLDALTGENIVELEEAFATAGDLPLNMELEFGHFFTEFGRINPVHPHAWRWNDQPVIHSRVFGGDGMRAPGLRLAWLLPTSWHSQIHLGVQNANGETMPSFLGEQEGSAFGHSHAHEEEGGDEHEFEEGLGGRPRLTRRVKNFENLAYLARWENTWDLNDETTLQLGTSHLFGPNPTGSDGWTWVGGGDLTLKWRPAQNDRGYPFICWENEFVYRLYHADRFRLFDEEEDPPVEVPLRSRSLRDWGLYSQVLWGFRKNWAVGVRFEYADGDQANVAFEEEEDAEPAFADTPRRFDPLRDRRYRVSPLLEWMPSEFSRIRFQYNYDRAQHLQHEAEHSFWLSLQVLWGKHLEHED